jgi:dTMP kinase
LKPVLVAIEGIDGAGTTTQTARLCAWLNAGGRPAHATREPSTGPVGRLIREVLAGQHAPFDRHALALLFAGDRMDHVAREIEPALARGQHVLTDRYYHSSFAYQTLDADGSWVRTLSARARRPDLTLLIDLPAEVAAARRRAAGRPDELFDDLGVQLRVAAAYRTLARELAATERIVVVPGDQPADEVFAALCREIEALLA